MLEHLTIQESPSLIFLSVGLASSSSIFLFLGTMLICFFSATISASFRSAELSKNIPEHSKASTSKAVVHFVYKCDNCGFQCNSKHDLECHIVDVHNNYCDICGSKFLLKNELEKHIENSHNISCTKCDENFITEEKLGRHMKDKHTTHSTSLTTDDDHVTLEEIHPQIETEKEEDSLNNSNIMCIICGKEEISVDKLKEHFDSCHNFKCENCDETCETVDSLGQHISTNHKEDVENENEDDDSENCEDEKGENENKDGEIENEDSKNQNEGLENQNVDGENKHQKNLLNRNVDAALTEESEGNENDDEDHPTTNDNEGCDQALSQYLEISVESNVGSDSPGVTEKEVQGIDDPEDEKTGDKSNGE